jgi:hypothetical protein
MRTPGPAEEDIEAIGTRLEAAEGRIIRCG